MMVPKSVLTLRQLLFVTTATAIVWLFPVSAIADQAVKVVLKQSSIDQRGNYKHELLDLILKASEDKFGPWHFVLSPPMPRKRALVEMKAGRTVNLHIAPAERTWEAELIPIRIPIRKGLLNYRILMINKNNKARFANIKTATDLKKLNVGLRQGWTTTKVMKALNFPIVPARSYDGLFSMLDHARFDFIPRGINEVFGEFRARAKTHKDIMIEPDLIIRMPMPVYLYVSPKEPELAERVRYGFNKVRENGKFDTLFNRHFRQSIDDAKLSSRRLIDVGNPLLSKETPFDNPDLWFKTVLPK